MLDCDYKKLQKNWNTKILRQILLSISFIKVSCYIDVETMIGVTHTIYME